MKRLISLLSVVMLFLFISTGAFATAILTVNIYNGYGTTGGGAPYSSLAGSFNSSDIMFATSTGYAWHPFSLAAFGADIIGNICVGADGTYSFTLNSDDGSRLFIDSTMVVDNGGAHSPTINSGSTFLTAGSHPFEVQFFEDFGGPSGVDLTLPAGVSYCASAPAPIPEPGTLLLLSSGLVGLVGYAKVRSNRKKK